MSSDGMSATRNDAPPRFISFDYWTSSRDDGRLTELKEPWATLLILL